MATLTFSRKEVEKHFKLSESTIEKIRLFGVPIEIKGEEVEIEVLPHRPDLLSLPGFARAIKTFIGKDKGLKNYKVNSPEKDYKVLVDSSVSEVRPYTVCAIMKNLKFDDETIKTIIEVQEKLHTTLGRNRKKIAIGIYPLEKISLPIKYEARKPENIVFRPLESNKEMNGREILGAHPAGMEYAHLLENASKYPVFADKQGKILSMPPIINSHETGKVTNETKEIFIECSGSHLESLKKTLAILTTMFAELGGKIYAMELDYGKNNKMISPDLTPINVKVNLEEVNSTLGLNLKERDIGKLLPKMGCDYKKGAAKIPAWRADVMHPIDVIEDIAIAYGYDSITPELPNISTIGEESDENKLKNKIANLLAGLGFLEIFSYHLMREEDFGYFNGEKIALASTKTEYKLLRNSLAASSMRVLAENKDREYPQKIFEIGAVFLKDQSGKSETGVNEKDSLIIALAPGNFTSAKEALNYIFRMLYLKINLKEISKKGFIEGRTGEIILNNKSIGYIGEVHPETLKGMNLKMPCAVFEMSLEEIFSSIKK